MKKYDAYKDSGVKWIGEIPNHWEAIKISRVHPIIGSGTTPLSSREDYYSEKGLNWLQTGDLNNGLITETSKKITPKAVDECKMKFYPIHSVVIAMYGATIGKVGLLDIETATNQACCIIVPSKRICPKYTFYSFIIAKEELLLSSFGGGQPNISQDIIRKLKVPVPPLSEQQSIASYLDVKTEKIDKMIAKAEKKIEYLDELKQSLITRAVIRGLNPNAPLKDSGMKWIGEIPEHWKIMPFKYYGKLCKGLTFSKADLTATGVPVISYGQIHSKENKSVRFFEEGIRFIPRELTKNGDSALVKQGDFIFADTSEDLEGCGNCVYNDTTNPIYAGYHTIIYKTRERDCKYLAYLFRSNVWRSQIRCRVSGIKVYSITQGIMSQVNILLPPMSEQKEISTYLDTKCSKIDHIIATQKKKIAYLQELKQSLITNVVTGKIKVS